MKSLLNNISETILTMNEIWFRCIIKKMGKEKTTTKIKNNKVV